MLNLVADARALSPGQKGRSVLSRCISEPQGIVPMQSLEVEPLRVTGCTACGAGCGKGLEGVGCPVCCVRSGFH